MNQLQKLCLDGLAIAGNIIAIIQFVSDGQYFVSAVLIVILIALIVYGVRVLTSKPYKVLSVSWQYEFRDPQGTIVDVQKSVLLVPKEKNITNFEDKNIPATGEIVDVKSNHGFVSERSEGGAKTITTTFETALDRNKEFNHVITYVGENCFPDETESVVHSTIHDMEKAEITLKFHRERRPSNFKAVIRIDSTTRDVSGEKLNVDDLTYVLTDTNPKRGTVYALSWNW